MLAAMLSLMLSGSPAALASRPLSWVQGSVCGRTSSLTRRFAPTLRRAVSSVLVIEGLPGEREYAKPVGATRVKYIELLEDNTHIVYPAIAIFVLLLIGLGILQAWRTDDMSGELKAELKREIIRELRVNVHGMTVDALGKALKLQPLMLLKVLEEMAAAGITESRTDTRRHTTWRVKGTGTAVS